MPDEIDDLTPREQEVRRLLAEARHDEPVPDDVVARLDRVLAGLAEEPARLAPVADLATRRRRAAGLLVAAAAVLVAGVALGQVIGPEGGSSGSADEAGAPREAAGADADSGTSSSEAEAPEPGDDAQDAVPQGTEAAPEAPADRRDAVVTLTAEAFGDQVFDAQGAIPRSTSSAYLAREWTRTRAAARACEAPSWGSGTFVPVRYDGAPGVLVFRRASGDTQVADLFLCGATEPERSITLPAP